MYVVIINIALLLNWFHDVIWMKYFLKIFLETSEFNTRVTDHFPLNVLAHVFFTHHFLPTLLYNRLKYLNLLIWNPLELPKLKYYVNNKTLRYFWWFFLLHQFRLTNEQNKWLSYHLKSLFFTKSNEKLYSIIKWKLDTNLFRRFRLYRHTEAILR